MDSSLAQMLGRARSPTGMLPKLFSQSPPPGSPTRPASLFSFASSELTRVDAPAPANDARPFAGRVLCVLGADKVVEEQAAAMGARVEPLGEDTTHLVAEDAGSPVFAEAARRLPIMHPAWVRDAHAAWARGQDVDVDATGTGYRLLARLQLEISGRDAHIAGTLAVQERLTREDAALAQRAHELREQLAELAAQRAALQADTAAADEHINKIRAERDALKVRAYDVRAAMDGEDA